MFRLRIRTLLLLLILLILAWSGGSYWMEYRENAARRARELLAPPVGAECTVHFSSQDLGQETRLPAITDQQPTGSAVSGRFAAHNDQWIVLDVQAAADDASRRLWIPRTRVLLIEVHE